MTRFYRMEEGPNCSSLLQGKSRRMTGSTGRAVKNQFILETEKGEYFQSYDSIIAFAPRDGRKKTEVDVQLFGCSKTTNQYLYEFLQKTRFGSHDRSGCGWIDNVRAQVKAKKIKLTELNRYWRSATA